MSIIGLSFGFHDAGVSVIKDGDILFAGHAERYSKIKNDGNLNAGIITDALRFGEPETVAYYENPVLKASRLLYTGQFTDLRHQRFTVHGLVNQQLGEWPFGKASTATYGHHKSHAAAGFQTSPFDEATVVVADAIGEWNTITIWRASYNNDGQAQYKQLWKVNYPNSVGLFYSAVTDLVGLRPMDEEYILMGMSAYGRPRYYNELVGKYFANGDLLKVKENVHLGIRDNHTVKDEQDAYDYARSTQMILEAQLRRILNQAKSLNESNNLVYAGGVALNCLANRLLGEWYKNIWIMPNPGDAGSSLGAAALAYGKKLNWVDAYLGKTMGREYPVEGLVAELKKSGIVGVANGQAEFGPRALGNRSLLADPRGKNIKEKVNEIKQRQKFRPFAPVILEEHAHKHFNMPKNWNSSPYMQAVAKCKRPWDFPAVVHKDGTSRVQTVAPNCRSGIRQLLEAWYEETGCPMLLNTSLNVRGEPIVNDEADALAFQELYKVKVLT
jgi:carbamoyltransferase